MDEGDEFIDLILIHVGIKNQFCQLKVKTRTKRLPWLWISWKVDTNKILEIAFVLLKAKESRWTSTAWMVLHFDVIELWWLLKWTRGPWISLDFIVELGVAVIRVVDCFILIRYCYVCIMGWVA